MNAHDDTWPDPFTGERAGFYEDDSDDGEFHGAPEPPPFADPACLAVNDLLAKQAARVAELEAALRAIDAAARDCLLGATKLCTEAQADAVDSALQSGRRCLFVQSGGGPARAALAKGAA